MLQGCDAVISMLGQPAGEPPIFSQATGNVLAAIQQYNIGRYIVTTGLNVDTPADYKSDRVQAATEWMKTCYPQTTADKQVEYEVLSNSSVDWTMMRLPMIAQSNEEGLLAVSLADYPGEQISAGRLARLPLPCCRTGNIGNRHPLSRTGIVSAYKYILKSPAFMPGFHRFKTSGQEAGFFRFHHTPLV
ncbi:NAD(P)H-binding protein [Niabella yanshanensis]|uniref:NAD(P)H-binding protein n=1 Tax=Niabella yanshanensis TaxID=577386 RepID=A0ABZ0WAC8_9BACT|nr:NAD(P)H-binding protein [Niabella yanshanensis]